LNLADAAEAVLQDAQGVTLTAREIAQRAIDRGLIAPRSETPWTHLAKAIRKDNIRREQTGDAVRFETLSGGRFALRTGV
jgi:hypothetical protein